MVLVKGNYYYRAKTGETLRYDGWAMQMWQRDYDGEDRVCWDDVGDHADLEEVTWGTRAIPLQDFTDCEHY